MLSKTLNTVAEFQERLRVKAENANRLLAELTQAKYQLQTAFHARADAQSFVQRAAERSAADADVMSDTTSMLLTPNVMTGFAPCTTMCVIGAGGIIFGSDQQIAHLTSLLLSSCRGPTAPSNELGVQFDQWMDENEKYAAINPCKNMEQYCRNEMFVV